MTQLQTVEMAQVEEAVPAALSRKRTRELADRKGVVYALRLLVAILFFGLWELLTRTGNLDPFFSSRPSLIGERLWEWTTSGFIFDNLWVTVQETLLALGLGLGAGIAIGYVLARWRLGNAILLPHLPILNAVPRLVLAPMFMLWFGIGMTSKVALGFSLVFFVVFFNMYQGVKSVDKILIDNARALGATERQLRRHVLLPSAMSWIFASLHLAVSFAIIGAVVGEFIGASAGIGYIIAQSQGIIDTTGMITGIVVIAIFVLIVEAITAALERHLLRWKQ